MDFWYNITQQIMKIQDLCGHQMKIKDLEFESALKKLIKIIVSTFFAYKQIEQLFRPCS